MAFYSLAQGPQGKLRDYFLYHDKEFTKEEFITKYNSAIEKIQSYKKPGQVIGAEEVVGEMCHMYGFEELEPMFRIHTHGKNMKKVNKEKEDNRYPYIITD